jgi:hypothetical protein
MEEDSLKKGRQNLAEGFLSVVNSAWALHPTNWRTAEESICSSLDRLTMQEVHDLYRDHNQLVKLISESRERLALPVLDGFIKHYNEYIKSRKTSVKNQIFTAKTDAKQSFLHEAIIRLNIVINDEFTSLLQRYFAVRLIKKIEKRISLSIPEKVNSQSSEQKHVLLLLVIPIFIRFLFLCGLLIFMWFSKAYLASIIFISIFFLFLNGKKLKILRLFSLRVPPYLLIPLVGLQGFITILEKEDMINLISNKSVLLFSGLIILFSIISFLLSAVVSERYGYKTGLARLIILFKNEAPGWLFMGYFIWTIFSRLFSKTKLLPDTNISEIKTSIFAGIFFFLLGGLIISFQLYKFFINDKKVHE